jgi:arylformamidase
MNLYFEEHYIETEHGIDLSIEIGNPNRFAHAWYVGSPTIEPVVGDSFIGSVAEGSSVNFRNIHFNPHGHGTHTETYGHITKEIYSINKVSFPLLMKTVLVSIEPSLVKQGDGTEDCVIDANQLRRALKEYGQLEAVILRTLPNIDKINKDYSSSNPAYMNADCAKVLEDHAVQHFLIDLPSVDKEVDEGKLAFHHAFWNVPSSPDSQKTITELIYASEEVLDGLYMMNLQVAPFENDAAPSRPMIYKLYEK